MINDSQPFNKCFSHFKVNLINFNIMMMKRTNQIIISRIFDSFGINTKIKYFQNKTFNIILN